MADKLNNCPNCGGTLDDTGRCRYCETKVYDLTDINLDANNIHNVLRMRINLGNKPHIYDCYLGALEAHMYSAPMDVSRSFDGRIIPTRAIPTTTFNFNVVVMREVGDGND